MSFLEDMERERSIYVGDEEEKQAQKAEGQLSRTAVFNRYIALREAGEVITVTFATVGEDGALYGFDDEHRIVFVLPAEEIRVKKAPGRNVRLSLRENDDPKSLIGVPIRVCVEWVDKEEGFVIFCRAGDEEGSYSEKAYKEILGIVSQYKKTGEVKNRLWGTVVKIYRQYAVIDIGRSGVIGVCMIQNWKKGYTRTLSTAAERGKSYDFVAIDSGYHEALKSNVIYLSRKLITPDPWENIPEWMKPGEVINLRCVDVDEAHNWWWGVNKAIPDIEIMCNINRRKFPRPVIGVTYRCTIRNIKVTGEKRVFWASPFDVADSTNARGRFVTNGRIKDIVNGMQRTAEKEQSQQSAQITETGVMTDTSVMTKISGFLKGRNETSGN